MSIFYCKISIYISASLYEFTVMYIHKIVYFPLDYNIFRKVDWLSTYYSTNSTVKRTWINLLRQVYGDLVHLTRYFAITAFYVFLLIPWYRCYNVTLHSQTQELAVKSFSAERDIVVLRRNSVLNIIEIQTRFSVFSRFYHLHCSPTIPAKF